jgi:FSR family fosmidomycin resistance protein-like MFS transporter
MAFVALLGLLHALVDLCTVSTVVRAARFSEAALLQAFWLVLAYDLLAFGSQVVFGWLTDRFANPRVATLAGLTLAASSALLLQYPTLSMVCAGVGNALFHLGAGSAVLRLGVDRAFPSGVFVAPGALGLAGGLYFGAHPEFGPVWPLACVLGLGLCAAAPLRFPALTARVEPPRADSAPRTALLLLLISVAVRSLVGGAAVRLCPKTAFTLLALPLAAFLGKALGGWFGDRFGYISTSLMALTASAALFCLGQSEPLLILPGVLLFQMTMPITLVGVARIMPHRLATAFGWTCLALILGALPLYFEWGGPLGTGPLLLAWIAVSALALSVGLRLLGSRTLQVFTPSTESTSP